MVSTLITNYKTVKYGVPQGSVLGPLLFLIFINDLNIAIKNSETFHFADDTCLLNIKDSIKKINKVVNKDLKFLIQWLHANKISLNVAKTEVIIFRRKKKQLDFDLNLKICGKKLQASSYVKYLGIYLDEYLDWSPHVNHLSHKLVKANAMLCKLRHHVNEATIKSIYYAIFHSHLSYVCTAWGQNLNRKHRISLLPKKAIRIISFTHYDAHTLSIFVKLNIIKFSDLISLCNCFFIFKHFISKPASVFSHVFILASNIHEQNTRFASHGLLTKPTCNTSKYGTNGFAASAIASWNFFQKTFPSNNLRQIFYSQLKVLIKNYFFNSYNQISV